MTKNDVYEIIMAARNISDEDILNYLKINPFSNIVDAMIVLCGVEQYCEEDSEEDLDFIIYQEYLEHGRHSAANLYMDKCDCRSLRDAIVAVNALASYMKNWRKYANKL